MLSFAPSAAAVWHCDLVRITRERMSIRHGVLFQRWASRCFPALGIAVRYHHPWALAQGVYNCSHSRADPFLVRWWKHKIMSSIRLWYYVEWFFIVWEHFGTILELQMGVNWAQNKVRRCIQSEKNTKGQLRGHGWGAVACFLSPAGPRQSPKGFPRGSQNGVQVE